MSESDQPDPPNSLDLGNLFDPVEHTVLPDNAPELQRRAIITLWDMVQRYSAYPQADRDAHLRWVQLRHKVALIARLGDEIDGERYAEESGAYISVIAEAMGGVAFTTQKPSAPRDV